MAGATMAKGTCTDQRALAFSVSKSFNLLAIVLSGSVDGRDYIVETSS